MNRVIREFFGTLDIAIMLLIAAAALAVAVPGLLVHYQWAVLLLGSVVYFTSEYTTHRFFFHMKRPSNPWLLKLVERLHYQHHEAPNDLHLLFLPLWYTLPQFALLGLITWAITRSVGMVGAILAGISCTLLYYEWMHYVAHRPISPLTPWGRWMKKYHLWHHFKNEHYWYGVTNPSLDMLLGTYKPEKEIASSGTTRTIGQ